MANAIKMLTREQLEDYKFLKNNFTIDELKWAVAVYIIDKNDKTMADKFAGYNMSEFEFAAFKKYLRNTYLK